MSRASTWTGLPGDAAALLSLIESLDDVAVILLDGQGVVRWWNSGAERIMGYPAAEILGESFTRFYPPEALTLGHPQRELDAAASTGSYVEEGWRVRKDGSRFWARVRIVALRDEGRVVGFGKITRDLTEHKQAQEQLANAVALLEQTARTDALSGLPNRRAWDEVLSRELAIAKRSGAALSIAVLDLDCFKAINDRQGHRAGDQVIQRCVAAWRATLRSADTLARYGGDEFALCLPGCNSEAAQFMLARVHATMPEPHTCSIGVATWDGIESEDELFGRADKAMYQAKNSGRARTIAAAMHTV